jgi:hypothetical protein
MTNKDFIARAAALSWFTRITHIVFYNKLSPADKGVMDKAYDTMDPDVIRRTVDRITYKNLSLLTLIDLRDLGKEFGIKYVCKFTKQGLIDELLKQGYNSYEKGQGITSGGYGATEADISRPASEVETRAEDEDRLESPT